MGKNKKVEITKDYDFMKVVNFVLPSLESVEKDKEIEADNLGTLF